MILYKGIANPQPVLPDYKSGRARGYFKKKEENRVFWGVGIQNVSGGYEVRTAMDRFTKCSVTAKNYTFVPAHLTEPVFDHQPSSLEANVFEGFFDFLSGLAHSGLEKSSNDIIVLNSLTFVGRCLPMLKSYHKVNLFLDNDGRGDQAVQRISEALDGRVKDYRSIYRDFKDFNEFLTHK